MFYSIFFCIVFCSFIFNISTCNYLKIIKIFLGITEINISKKAATLSIKALEEKQTEDAVKKYGSKDSGGVLGEILGPLIKKKKNKK